MTTPSFKSAEVLKTAWFAQGAGAVVPASAERGAVTAASTDPATGARRGAWSKVLRVSRDLVLGLAVIATIPLTFIGVTSSTRGWNTSGLRERVLEVERLRPLMMPVDATVTPEAAGAAMRRLVPTKGRPSFPVPVDRVHGVSWDAELPTGLFDGMRSNVWNGPEATKIVAAAGKGFSQRETDWLRALAESPVWQDLDLVARAERVDLLGQRFQAPFRDDAMAYAMPVPSLMRNRQLAYAGVARAAYYVSIGDHARAEGALRAVVSFGFASLDDGVSTIEGLIGRVVIDAGRDGLRQLYALDGRNEAVAAPFATRSVRRGVRPPSRSATTIRDEALSNVTNPALPRSFRFGELGTVAWSTCADVRSVVLGPSDEVQRVFDVARKTLAQSAAERQYIDLLERDVSAMPVRPVPPNMLLQIVQGAAVVTSTVTGNPRIASCTRATIGDFSPR